MGEKFNILITSLGKRIQLIEHLKQKFKIIGCDADSLIAGKYFVDVFYKIPKADEPGYLKSIYQICIKEKVQAVIPLYEEEFDLLNTARNKFKVIGTELLLSHSEVISLCKDKKKTYEFFKNLSLIQIPKVYSQSEIEEIVRSKEESVMPLFIKPVSGMGSINTFKINNVKELAFFKEYVKDNIIEEFIDGEEFTVDCLVDFHGNPIYIIPRKRIEVRAGEVVKTCTVHDDSIINNTRKVIDYLNKASGKVNKGTMGPLTIQFIKTYSNKLYLIEINPRFGGGVPLSFECGADYADVLDKLLRGQKVEYDNSFEEKTMLRYDNAVFI